MSKKAKQIWMLLKRLGVKALIANKLKKKLPHAPVL